VPDNNEGEIKWEYLGPGRGNYIAQQELLYVGSNQGDYDRVLVKPARSWFWRCLCIGIFLFLAIIILVVALILSNRPKPFKIVEPVERALITGFHCDMPLAGAALAAAAIVEESWMAIDLDGDGYVKKLDFDSWLAQGLFSETVHGLIANLTDADHNGLINNDEYVEALKAAHLGQLTEKWIEAAWLLGDKNLDGQITRTEMGLLQREGHLKTAIDQHLFQGDGGNHDGTLNRLEFQHGLTLVAAASASDLGELVHQVKTEYWPDDKRAWCCSQQGIACEVRSTTSAEPTYDCKLDFENRLSWPEMKRAWCCSRYHVACFDEVNAPYNCDAGYSNWRAGWSEHKKAWCCFHTDKGCVVESDPYDCDAGYSNWKAGWSNSKKHWCCDHRQRGCEVPFDCDAGYSNWKAGWSEPKKQWCCVHQRRGCQEVVQPVHEVVSLPYDCDAGYSNWKAGWSIDKKAWCCDHVHRGCEAYNYMVRSVSKPYDCAAGYINWQAGWSANKKHWCCDHEQKGCETHYSLPYDCAAGYSNWQAGWSVEKKRWCCDHEHKGCAPASLPYDCAAGYSNWRAGWSVSKKEWCCAHQQRGCV